MSEELDALREALRWAMERVYRYDDVGPEGDCYWCDKPRPDNTHDEDCPHGRARRLAGLEDTK